MAKIAAVAARGWPGRDGLGSVPAARGAEGRECRATGSAPLRELWYYALKRPAAPGKDARSAIVGEPILLAGAATAAPSRSAKHLPRRRASGGFDGAELRCPISTAGGAPTPGGALPSIRRCPPRPELDLRCSCRVIIRYAAGNVSITWGRSESGARYPGATRRAGEDGSQPLPVDGHAVPIDEGVFGLMDPGRDTFVVSRGGGAKRVAGGKGKGTRSLRPSALCHAAAGMTMCPYK